jgi:protein phosphatase
MFDAGVFSENDYFKSYTRNRLTQCIGISEREMTLKPYFTDLDSIRNGDYFLICSDGLYSVLKNKEILEIVTLFEDSKIICDTLVKTALDKGSRDNITAVIVKIKSNDKVGGSDYK